MQSRSFIQQELMRLNMRCNDCPNAVFTGVSCCVIIVQCCDIIHWPSLNQSIRLPFQS